jgi:hypothetical protein
MAEHKACGCRVTPDSEKGLITYCPMHAAAGDMVDTLRYIAARLNIEEEENPGGKYMLATMRGYINNLLQKAMGR